MLRQTGPVPDGIASDFCDRSYGTLSVCLAICSYPLHGTHRSLEPNDRQDIKRRENTRNVDNTSKPAC